MRRLRYLLVIFALLVLAGCERYKSATVLSKHAEENTGYKAYYVSLDSGPLGAPQTLRINADSPSEVYSMIVVGETYCFELTDRQGGGTGSVVGVAEDARCAE